MCPYGVSVHPRRYTMRDYPTSFRSGSKNPIQQRIVADNREQTNVLALAGPGSGKTRMLVHRIAYLVRPRRSRAHLSRPGNAIGRRQLYGPGGPSRQRIVQRCDPPRGGTPARQRSSTEGLRRTTGAAADGVPLDSGGQIPGHWSVAVRIDIGARRANARRRGG